MLIGDVERWCRLAMRRGGTDKSSLFEPEISRYNHDIGIRDSYGSRENTKARDTV